MFFAFPLSLSQQHSELCEGHLYIHVHNTCLSAQRAPRCDSVGFIDVQSLRRNLLEASGTTPAEQAALDSFAAAAPAASTPVSEDRSILHLKVYEGVLVIVACVLLALLLLTAIACIWRRRSQNSNRDTSHYKFPRSRSYRSHSLCRKILEGDSSGFSGSEGSSGSGMLRSIVFATRGDSHLTALQNRENPLLLGGVGTLSQVAEGTEDSRCESASVSHSQGVTTSRLESMQCAASQQIPPQRSSKPTHRPAEEAAGNPDSENANGQRVTEAPSTLGRFQLTDAQARMLQGTNPLLNNVALSVQSTADGAVAAPAADAAAAAVQLAQQPSDAEPAVPEEADLPPAFSNGPTLRVHEYPSEGPALVTGAPTRRDSGAQRLSLMSTASGGLGGPSTPTRADSSKNGVAQAPSELDLVGAVAQHAQHKLRGEQVSSLLVSESNTKRGLLPPSAAIKPEIDATELKSKVHSLS